MSVDRQVLAVATSTAALVALFTVSVDTPLKPYDKSNDTIVATEVGAFEGIAVGFCVGSTVGN